MPDPHAVSTASSAWDWIKNNIGTVGFFISLALAIIKILETVNARRDRTQDQSARVNDAWFKTIVLDKAIPDLRQFLEVQRAALKRAASSKLARPYMAVLLAYIPESEELKARLQPIRELSSHAYENLIEFLEDLDDLVSPYCAHADDAAYSKETLETEWKNLQREMDRSYRNSLSVLRRVHFELSRGRDPDKSISTSSARQG